MAGVYLVRRRADGQQGSGGGHHAMRGMSSLFCCSPVCLWLNVVLRFSCVVLQFSFGHIRLCPETFWVVLFRSRGVSAARGVIRCGSIFYVRFLPVCRSFFTLTTGLSD